jgi:hypothetical protein
MDQEKVNQDPTHSIPRRLKDEATYHVKAAGYCWRIP